MFEQFPTHLLLVLCIPEDLLWDSLAVQTPFGSFVQRRFPQSLSAAEERLWNDTSAVLLESRTSGDSAVEPDHLQSGKGATPHPSGEAIEAQEGDQTITDTSIAKEDETLNQESVDNPIQEPVKEKVCAPMPSLVFDLDDD